MQDVKLHGHLIVLSLRSNVISADLGFAIGPGRLRCRDINKTQCSVIR
jgi:hypothetical protein